MKKRLIYSVVTAIILLIMVVGGFVLSTLLEYPLDLLEVVKARALQVRQAAILEEDSAVRQDDLKSFLLFGEHQDRFAFLKKQQQLGKLVPHKDLFLVHADIKLPRLLLNNCSELYCYQHRLRFAEIPSFFWKGLINTEDRRFLEHRGVDFRGMARALIVDILHMKLVQGASTLTQQLVKNLYLSSEKKLTRKLKEMILALYIELKFSKEEILTIYFNEVYWGSFQGIKIKGIYAASLFYFKKSIFQLNPYEATILISLLKGPGYYGPIRHLDRLIKRVTVVYGKLKEIGLVSTLDNFHWNRDRWLRWQKELIKRQKKKHWRPLVRIMRSNYSFINDYQQYVLARSMQRVLAWGNKKISSVTDDKLQGIALIYSLEREEVKKFAYYSRWGVDPYEYIKKHTHQVGSTLKPLIYSILVKQGVSFDQLVSTKRVAVKMRSGGVWRPHEGSRIKQSEVTVREALQRSLNNPLIRLVEEKGFTNVESELKAILPKLQTPLAEFPAQMLGAIELTLDDLLQAYYRFIKNECSLNREFYEATLDILSDPTKTTLRHSVNKRLSNFRFFGKTGTTNKSIDNLFVFFDGKLLGAIWIGLEGKRPEKSLHLGGSRTAFKVFQYFILNRGGRFNLLGCPDYLTVESE